VHGGSLPGFKDVEKQVVHTGLNWVIEHYRSIGLEERVTANVAAKSPLKAYLVNSHSMGGRGSNE